MAPEPELGTFSLCFRAIAHFASHPLLLHLCWGQSYISEGSGGILPDGEFGRIGRDRLERAVIAPAFEGRSWLGLCCVLPAPFWQGLLFWNRVAGGPWLASSASTFGLILFFAGSPRKNLGFLGPRLATTSSSSSPFQHGCPDRSGFFGRLTFVEQSSSSTFTAEAVQTALASWASCW